MFVVLLQRNPTLVELLQINNWIYLNMIMLPYIIPLDNPLLACNAINEASGSWCFVCLLFPWPKVEVLLRRKFCLNKGGNEVEEIWYSSWWPYGYAHLGYFALSWLLFIHSFAYSKPCTGSVRKQWWIRQIVPKEETKSIEELVFDRVYNRELVGSSCVAQGAQPVLCDDLEGPGGSGREARREGICVDSELIPFVVQQKLAQ